MTPPPCDAPGAQDRAPLHTPPAMPGAPCPRCDGTGRHASKAPALAGRPCPWCHASGIVPAPVIPLRSEAVPAPPPRPAMADNVPADEAPPAAASVDVDGAPPADEGP